jgi:hypothetical protein
VLAVAGEASMLALRHCSIAERSSWWSVSANVRSVFAVWRILPGLRNLGKPLAWSSIQGRFHLKTCFGLAEEGFHVSVRGYQHRLFSRCLGIM